MQEWHTHCWSQRAHGGLIQLRTVAAQGDSTAKPDDSSREAWEEGFEVEWVEAREAAERMSAEADGRVIEKGLADMRNTGYDI